MASPQRVKLDELLSTCVDASLRGCAEIRRVQAQRVSGGAAATAASRRMEAKDEQELAGQYLTEADLAAQAAIVAALQNAWPGAHHRRGGRLGAVAAGPTRCRASAATCARSLRARRASRSTQSRSSWTRSTERASTSRSASQTCSRSSRSRWAAARWRARSACRRAIWAPTRRRSAPRQRWSWRGRRAARHRAPRRVARRSDRDDRRAKNPLLAAARRSRSRTAAPPCAPTRRDARVGGGGRVRPSVEHRTSLWDTAAPEAASAGARRSGVTSLVLHFAIWARGHRASLERDALGVIASAPGIRTPTTGCAQHKYAADPARRRPSRRPRGARRSRSPP